MATKVIVRLVVARGVIDLKGQAEDSFAQEFRRTFWSPDSDMARVLITQSLCPIMAQNSFGNKVSAAIPELRRDPGPFGASGAKSDVSEPEALTKFGGYRRSGARTCVGVREIRPPVRQLAEAHSRQR